MEKEMGMLDDTLHYWKDRAEKAEAEVERLREDYKAACAGRAAFAEERNAALAEVARLNCLEEIRGINSKTVAACVAKLTDERTVSAILRAEVERLKVDIRRMAKILDKITTDNPEIVIAAGRGEGE